MSYSHSLLVVEISEHLRSNPRHSVAQLAQSLKVSRRTIQDVLSKETGKSFSALREEILMSSVKDLFLSRPELAIKEISFALGFNSPRSFARVVKRACGLSPHEFRSQLVLAAISATPS
jgi:AraC-like DNA-binding protein